MATISSRVSSESAWKTLDADRRPAVRFSVDSLTDQLRHQVLSKFSRARIDVLWVHAAAVAGDGSALLLVGPSARGKSTLSTRLCENGWRLLSDDAAPVRMDSNEVLPFL